jgi:hypothetical protein
MKAGGLSETSARTFTTTCSSHIQKTRIRIEANPELRKVQEISAQGEFGPSQISVHMWSNARGYTNKPFRKPNSNTLQTDRKQLDCLPPVFTPSSISRHQLFFIGIQFSQEKNRHPFQLCHFCVYFLNRVSLKGRKFKR